MPNFPDLGGLQVTPATALYENYIPDAQINAYESTTEGRTAIVLDFNSGAGLLARDLGTVFIWPTTQRLAIYAWQPSLIPMPENVYGRASDWDDGGYVGDKFIQGIEIEADTLDAPKTFQLQSSDDLSFHPLLEMPAIYNGQSVKTFSCIPFIAHSVRVVSTDGVAWRVWSQRVKFQPFPPSCLNWQTELTSLGGLGWNHAREANIPYISTAPVTFTLTFDSMPPIVLVLPSSGGLQVKTKVTLPANKWKLIALQLSSSSAFRVFQEDVELKIKSWGSADNYHIAKPIGGKANTMAEV